MRTRLLLAIASLQSILLSGGTQIATSLVYPRIDIQADEHIISRTRLILNGRLGKVGDFRADVEFGSTTISQQDRVRIYSLSFGTEVGRSHHIAIGRLSQWNPLYVARIDGVRALLRLGSTGELTYLGGIVSSNDFSNKNYSAQHNAHYLEWRTKVRSNRYSFNAWIVNSAESSRLFSGISYRQKLVWDIVSVGYLSWDFNGSQLQKVRARFSRSFRTSHTLFMEYRYRSLSVVDPYPWVSEHLSPKPVVSLGVTSRISPTISWTNTVLKRANDDHTSIYFKSMFHWSAVAISVITERQNLAESTGGTFSITHDFSNSLSIGGSFSYRSYSFSEDFNDLSVTGLYGWVEFQPNSQFQLRFTSQFYRNRFFNLDGRAGLSLNYAI